MLYKILALSCLLLSHSFADELTLDSNITLSPKGQALGFIDGVGWLDKVSDPKFSADVISAFYMKNMASALQARRSKVNDSLWLPTFTCENRRLATMSQTCPVIEGELSKTLKHSCGKEAELSLTFQPGKGYGYTHLNPSHNCHIQADEDGKITSTGHSCDSKAGDNFFKHNAFFRFPLLADQCCAHKGCAENVDANLEQLRKNYVALSKKFRDARGAKRKARNEETPAAPLDEGASPAQ